MTIVFDSGALIASERNDPRLTAIIAATRRKRMTILVPATVVAETWRGPSTHPLAARLLGSITGFPELDGSAGRRVGTLLALAKTSAIVDGSVVDIALSKIPSTIVTSDPGDIVQLLQSANVSHAILGSTGVSQASIVILPV